MQLRREGFLNHGFTQGCPGCQATLGGTSRQGHSGACRRRMEEAIRASPEGQQWVHKQRERENDREIGGIIEKAEQKRMRRE